MERAVVRHGTAIKATTAGRKPLNAFSIHTLSRTCVKNNAMAKIIRKEGRIVPKAQQRAPKFLRNLYPTKIDIFTAKIPGNDCVTEKISIKSSFVNFPVNQRLHGIATTDGKCSYLDKCQK